MTLQNAIKDQIRGSLVQFKSSASMANALEAFRAVYEKLDRIISGHPVNVRMHVGPTGSSMLDNAPGWTDGQTIYLNANMIERDLGMLPMGTVVLYTKAVNFHELAHDMFSPRQRDDIFKWVVEQGSDYTSPLQSLWWYAFNGLEDQRIETLFTGLFEPAGRYFEMIVLKWMTNNSGFIAESYPLIYGRKFLPTTVQIPARAAFVGKYGEALASEFEAVIDSFLKLKFPGDTLKGQQAIRKYVEALNKMRAFQPYIHQPTPSLPTFDNGGSEGPTSMKYDPTLIKKGAAKQKDQADALEKADQVEPRETESTDQDGDDTDSNVDEVNIPGDEGDDAEQDGEAQTGKGKSLTGKGKSTEGESDDGSDDASGGKAEGNDGESTAPGQSESGQASASNGAATSQEAVSAIYDAFHELSGDEDFMQEIQDTVDNINDLIRGDEGAAWGDSANYTVAPVSHDAITASRKMTNTLSRLRAELEETRIHRQTSGKLDMGRYQARQPWETNFFSQWEPGVEEDADLEVVVIIDISYSMDRMMGITSEALWTVKRAMEPLDSRVTVLGFSEQSFVMYQPFEKVGRSQMRLFSSRSSTEPDEALTEAKRLFEVSTRAQKLLVAITDGEWQGDRKRQDELIADMHDMDVVTTLIDIDSGYGHTGDDHGMKIMRSLDDIRDMPKVAVDIVSEAMVTLSQNMSS